jgi:hypothetical protein
VADLLVSLFEVAVIIALPDATPVTTASDADDTVTTDVAEEDQLTSLSVELLLYVTVAMSAAVAPTFIVVDAGVTATDITVGLGVAVGVGLAVAVGDGLTVAVGVGVTVGLGVAVGDGSGVGLAVARGVIAKSWTLFGPSSISTTPL